MQAVNVHRMDGVYDHDNLNEQIIFIQIQFQTHSLSVQMCVHCTTHKFNANRKETRFGSRSHSKSIRSVFYRNGLTKWKNSIFISHELMFLCSHMSVLCDENCETRENVRLACGVRDDDASDKYTLYIYTLCFASNELNFEFQYVVQ